MAIFRERADAALHAFRPGPRGLAFRLFAGKCRAAGRNGDLLIGKSWTNPVFAAVAVFALFRISRRLWPQTPGRWLIPPLLLATSAQLLTMAMTPYAMTAHLAFNLLWLWCFLRTDRRGDLGALAAGFVATGLHQIVFHPVFVAPFIAELLLAGRWRRAGYFIIGYALIGLFGAPTGSWLCRP